MTPGKKLIITFLDGTNAERNFSFSYVKSASTASQIKTLAQTIITNGSIFSHVPVTAKSAKLQTVTETDVDIS